MNLELEYKKFIVDYRQSMSYIKRTVNDNRKVELIKNSRSLTQINLDLLNAYKSKMRGRQTNEKMRDEMVKQLAFDRKQLQHNSNNKIRQF